MPSIHSPEDVPLDRIRPYFEAEGLDVLAVTAASPAPDAESAYARWLDEGRAGAMDYMHRHRHAKYRPERMLSGCRSIVLVGLNYYQALPSDTRKTDREAGPEAWPHAELPAEPAAGPHGRVARYAWGRDYHKTLGKRLKRLSKALAADFDGHRFRGFTDATPLSERYYAARAGLGFQGRNTLLIHPELGSWFFIAEVLATLPIEETALPPQSRSSCPPGCRLCIEACPTAALSGPYDFDARLCISYLTIEHADKIEPRLMERMGSWVFGCDRCQEACPLNARVQPTSVEDFRRPIAGARIELSQLLALENDDEVRSRLAGSPLLRAKRRGLVRNACIAAGNAGAAELLPQLDGLKNDQDPVVAQAADWAAARLRRLTDSAP
ncbi:MAG: tRNA epoxyqueuosine(34) reductase QueG [Spirochaetes bacterium]|nr:tRNA epoxyqueuosine(34) reductase QueG [Spirochaetota bacterium]